jgi:hypothetical protein
MRTLEETIDEETEGIKKEWYLKYQRNSGLKAGDKVKVLRSAVYMELGWNECWLDLKDKFIGKVFTIVEVEATGITLRYDENDSCAWHFPFFILEKVNTPTIEFLMPDDMWEKSECDEDDIQDFTFVTDTNTHYYYHDNGTLLYRVKKEQPE